MKAFIDDHRDVYGVEPICRVLPIALSTCRAHAAQRKNPDLAPAREQRDLALGPEVRRVFEENFRVYGVRKVWRQLWREGFEVARCTVDRLMRAMGLQGAVRGKPVRTTVSDRSARCLLDRVNRQFRASRPNALWLSDFTYGAPRPGLGRGAYARNAMRKEENRNAIAFAVEGYEPKRRWPAVNWQGDEARG